MVIVAVKAVSCSVVTSLVERDEEALMDVDVVGMVVVDVEAVSVVVVGIMFEVDKEAVSLLLVSWWNQMQRLLWRWMWFGWR